PSGGHVRKRLGDATMSDMPIVTVSTFSLLSRVALRVALRGRVRVASPYVRGRRFTLTLDTPRGLSRRHGSAPHSVGSTPTAPCPSSSSRSALCSPDEMSWTDTGTTTPYAMPTAT